MGREGVHDFEHPGFNNGFLVKTQDEYSVDANDRSPNESHHLALAFRILGRAENNFLRSMPTEQQRKARKTVIDMVLATDMAEHMALVSKLKTNLQKRLESPDDCIHLNQEVEDSVRILVLPGLIKVADIGHLYAKRDVHIKWSECLEEEMWRQGDVEKELALKASLLMDRDKPGVTKSQTGFMDDERSSTPG